MVDIKKNLLSQIDLYSGTISMPKGFEIDKDTLQTDIIKHQIQDCPFPFSREWDKLNTYLREHIFLEYNFTLVNKLQLLNTSFEEFLISTPTASYSFSVIPI